MIGSARQLPPGGLMRLEPILVSTLLLASCVASIDEPLDELSDQTSALIAENRIAFNRIAFNRIAFNRIAFNRIAFNRIAFNRLEANLDAVGDLLDTAEGQELFQFVVSCALPDGTILEAPDPNSDGTLEFIGEIGLAPGWIDQPMSRADRRWVSACLLARVNEYEITVPVSLRGPSAALATTPDEVAAFSLEEGAFFGDVFVEPEQPIQAFACRGAAQAAGEGGALVDRDCTEPDPSNPGKTICGMTYVGDCADFAAPASTYACYSRSNGWYEHCFTTPLFGPWWQVLLAVLQASQDPHYYREVVTTFVQP